MSKEKSIKIINIVRAVENLPPIEYSEVLYPEMLEGVSLKLLEELIIVLNLRRNNRENKENENG